MKILPISNGRNEAFWVRFQKTFCFIHDGASNNSTAAHYLKQNCQMLENYNCINDLLNLTIKNAFERAPNSLKLSIEMATAECEILRDGLLENLRDRVPFLVTYESNTAIAASYLDPRFKKLSFLPIEVRRRVRDYVKRITQEEIDFVVDVPEASHEKTMIFYKKLWILAVHMKTSVINMKQSNQVLIQKPTPYLSGR